MMNRMMAVGVGVVALAVGVAVGADEVKKEKAPAPTTQKSATTKPANLYCAVEGEPHAVDPKGKTVEYKGKTIGFCCDDCITAFKENPEKYMKTLK